MSLCPHMFRRPWNHFMTKSKGYNVGHKEPFHTTYVKLNIVILIEVHILTNVHEKEVPIQTDAKTRLSQIHF